MIWMKAIFTSPPVRNGRARVLAVPKCKHLPTSLSTEAYEPNGISRVKAYVSTNPSGMSGRYCRPIRASEPVFGGRMVPMSVSVPVVGQSLGLIHEAPESLQMPFVPAACATRPTGPINRVIRSPDREYPI